MLTKTMFFFLLICFAFCPFFVKQSPFFPFELSYRICKAAFYTIISYIFGLQMYKMLDFLFFSAYNMANQTKSLRKSKGFM